MPNWVANKIEFHGEASKIEEVFNMISGENRCIDFEKLIPMPKGIYRGNLGPKEHELYGKNNWYDWSVSHWGTKWNACETSRNGNVLYFETAWCLPVPIYEKLYAICAQLGISFEGSWSNEDWSSDSGTFYGDSDGFSIYDDDTEEERIERCRELWGFDPSEEY